MGAFGKVYDESVPQGSALANTLDTVIQNDKIAIDERIELEHYSFVDGTNDTTSATAQGRHVPGKVSAVYIGTTIQIAALTGMVTGALAYDTDLETLKIFNGSDWDTIGISGTPTAAEALSFSAYRSSTQTINSESWTKVELDSETFDYGSKFASYKYTPAEAGVYFFAAAVQSAGGFRNRSGIYKNGALALQGVTATNYEDVADTLSSVVTGLVVSDTNDYFELYCQLESSSNRVLSGASKTYLSGYKIASL